MAYYEAIGAGGSSSVSVIKIGSYTGAQSIDVYDYNPSENAYFFAICDTDASASNSASSSTMKCPAAGYESQAHTGLSTKFTAPTVTYSYKNKLVTTTAAVLYGSSTGTAHGTTASCSKTVNLSYTVYMVDSSEEVNVYNSVSNVNQIYSTTTGAGTSFSASLSNSTYSFKSGDTILISIASGNGVTGSFSNSSSCNISMAVTGCTAIYSNVLRSGIISNNYSSNGDTYTYSQSCANYIFIGKIADDTIAISGSYTTAALTIRAFILS